MHAPQVCVPVMMHAFGYCITAAPNAKSLARLDAPAVRSGAFGALGKLS